MYPGTRFHGKSPRSAKASDTTGFRCAPETAPMNRMIAITISPGATTADARLIWPLACSIAAAGGDQHRMKVPSSSENSRRYSRLGSIEIHARAELEHQRCGRARSGRCSASGSSC